ncbi:MAG: ComEC/Rec2 family competence protein [Sphingobium sp.]|uniref:ComEC/Rec2 family competence protein n=1 Tax=Sphingobium sp. TaxID=1912891 RepID=UPI0029BD1B9F|nr:ComEC/Rec2 family competence protein [Sphingobium sp.]MDX3908986.1 ComEC/Rec2 family competence protein [Sphingobium sp.]
MAFEPGQTHLAVGLQRYGTIFLAALEGWLEREREHVPLWLPVGLGSGIAAWFVLPNPMAWASFCCLMLAMALGAAFLPDGGRVRRIVVAGGLLGCAGCLIVWGKAMVAGTPPIARAAFVELVGQVQGVEPLPAQRMTRLIIRPVARDDLPAKIRLNVMEKDWPQNIAAGATVRFRARLMPPAPPAVPGAYDFAQRAFFMGIGATGRALPPIEVVTPAPSAIPPVRQRLSSYVQEQVEGGAGAIAATLASGDRGAISEADAEAMRRSGLAHLLSISGLHVTALIGAVIFLIFRVLALSRRAALRWPLMLIAAAAGAIAGIAYTLMTGADVPTVRSCVASLLVLGGLAMGREAITLRLIAAGAVFVLLLWPESLVGPSFQMSFAAVVSIVALAEHPGFRQLTYARDEGWPMRLGRHIIVLFMTGIMVEVVLAPIALFHFHQAGMLGSLANLIAIPLTTFIVMPFEALALALDGVGAAFGWGLGAPAWWVVKEALQLLLYLAHAVAAQPYAVALLPAFGAGAFALVIGGGLWCLLWRTRWRWLGIAPVLAGCAMMLAARAPDVLVTGDGRHLAVRTSNGGMAVLRERAGDYVRDTLSESAGLEGELEAMTSLRQARCSEDLCAVTLTEGGRQWRLLATRSRDLVDVPVLARECAAADIVVSERWLPRNCVPRWLKIDKAMLRRTGGVAVDLRNGTVRTVRAAGDAHPWIMETRRDP